MVSLFRTEDCDVFQSFSDNARLSNMGRWSSLSTRCTWAVLTTHGSSIRPRKETLPQIHRVPPRILLLLPIGLAFVHLLSTSAAKNSNEKRWKETSEKKNPAKDRDHQSTLRIMDWLSRD